MRPKCKIAGLLAAAGLSSRMRDFKPLLPLNGTTVIENTVNSLRSAGVADVRAVVGYRGGELAAHLKALGVPAVMNARYAETDMFDSVAIGLQWIEPDADAFFLLPGDVPLVKRHSIKSMSKALIRTGAPLIYPMFCGRRGHPPLITKACFAAILAHDGRDGLRGALRPFENDALKIELPDPGLLMDADTPEDYAALRERAQSAETPSAADCETLLVWARTPEASAAHSRVVARVAQRIALMLKGAGHTIDADIVLAGGLLHDIAKGRPRHPLCGARMLCSLGYPAVARTVLTHNDPPKEAVAALDERALVFLADKMVIGTSVVGIDARFQRAFERFGADPAAARSIHKRKEDAMETARRIAMLLGEDSVTSIERMLKKQ